MSTHPEQSMKQDLTPPQQISGKYTLTQEKGDGAFSKVYEAINKSNQRFAVKTEKGRRTGRLKKEFQVYQAIRGEQLEERKVGVPKVYDLLMEKEHDFLVLELLGPSLSKMAEQFEGNLSLKTCLLVGIQLISTLKHIHSRGYVHCDVKPDNILVGRGQNSNQVYLVDYGFAKQYSDPLTSDNSEEAPRAGFVGTPLYASLNVMRRREASRRDDLESLAYVLIALKRGHLPWGEYHQLETHSGFMKRILKRKIEVSIQVLAEGFPGMLDFLEYVRKLKFNERPNYSILSSFFTKALETEGLTNDRSFDWSSRR